MTQASRGRAAWIPCAALLLAGCADFGKPIGGGAAPGPQEQRLQGIEARLADVARKVDNLNLAAQDQGLSRLENEVRGLRGDVERLRFDLEQSDKRNRELYADLDRRLTRLENEGKARLSMETQLGTPPPVPPDQEEEATYLAVFEKLRGGAYDEAVAGFRDQLQRWPRGKFADNAWYWMGEAQYAQKNFDAALGSFGALLEQFPASPKVPDALLKVAMAQVEKKQKDEARATLKRLVEQHPDSNAAGVARKRLEQLK